MKKVCTSHTFQQIYLIWSYKEMAVPFSIMCFSWNAAGLRLCETMSQAKADAARTGFKAFIMRKKPCLAPDFFEEIRSAINARRPSLVVMTTQDEDESDTYFHADLLPSSMPEIGYSLLKREKLDGVGEAASGISQIRAPTGKPSGSALRTSIYARTEIIPSLRAEEKLMPGFFEHDAATCIQGDRVSGAIAIYVWHPTYGKFVFISTHLPSGVTALKVGKGLDYASYRVASRSTNSLCLLRMYNQFVASLAPESRPDHVFLLGDLNYDIVIPGKKNIEVVSELAANVTAAKFKDLQKYDELKKAMEEVPLAGFKEGVSAEGPLFMPTWRMARGRPDTCVPDSKTTKIEVSCFGEPNEALGGLGWHDRILYREMMTSNYMAHCMEYNRIDVRNMHASTHAGVLGTFEMRSVT